MTLDKELIDQENIARQVRKERNMAHISEYLKLIESKNRTVRSLGTFYGEPSKDLVTANGPINIDTIALLTILVEKGIL